MPQRTPSLSPQLPILARRDEIVEAISRHQVVVLCGETGSGKTTQLPQIMLSMGLATHGMIAHTQPRRLAARAVAARIAEERGESLGATIGVKVRFQDVTSRATKVKLMTDGMLLAELTGDPMLRAYSAIIIDEAHERSLNIDFLLGYLRGLLPKRPDLKLVITSATIDPKRFADYFSSASPAASLPGTSPVIEVSGRGYPVDIRYHAYNDDPEQQARPEVQIEHVADAVDELVSNKGGSGDVLVFLPGEREIRLSADALRRRRLNAEVLTLFSRLTNEEQDRIFHPSGRQRVILSTNVAETSLTVPGIVYVVDTGLARLSRYDPARKIQRLPIEQISRASANQRAGRCGRIAPGVCIRLYSEDVYAAKPAFTDPEIRRTNLASVILQMKALKIGAIEDFPFLDPPATEAIKDGYETLFELGAITQADRDGAVTAIGERMSRVPVDPRIARMLIGAEQENALTETIVLAAALSIQDPRERPASRQQDADRAHAVFRDETSDFLTLLKLWDQYRHATDNMTGGEFFGWCREVFLSPARLREWTEMARQIRDVVEELGMTLNQEPATPDAIHRALLTGLISNVACREGDGSFDYRGVRGNVVQIFPGSVMFRKGPKWLMAAEIVQTTRLFARTVARVQPEWVEELAGHMFRHQFSDAHLDAETGEPSAWERVSMSGIVVVPRRRANIATLKQSDPQGAQLAAQARGIFIQEAIAACRWKTVVGYMEHNRRIRARATAVEAKLRRKDMIKSDQDLATWFDSRIPSTIREPIAFERWRSEAERRDPTILHLSINDVLKPEAAVGLDQTAFPDEIELGTGDAATLFPIEYALSPGKEEDGITLTIDLASVPLLTLHRADWLVPGLVPDLVAALIRTLPKPRRAAVEAKADAASIALACAQAMIFAHGALGAALSEALEVLHGVHIDPAEWSFRGLPAHLRLRVRVVEDLNGAVPKELAVDRDLPALFKRIEPRLRQLRATASRAAFGRRGLTTWDFGDIADSHESERDGATVVMHPTLSDDGQSVSLTLAATPREAETRTRAGLRRLFALTIAEEVKYYLESHPAWDAMRSQFAQLGTPEELRDQLTCIVAERTFMDGQTAIRTQAAFEERRTAAWGRLSTIARETCDAIARVLDARAQIARRFSGGTPRLWAESVADIREQAAYLMPRGFLTAVRWEQLRRYPVWVEVMRERLLNLREDGSKSESGAIAAIAPHWKRFTGWVASAAKEAASETETQARDCAEAAPAPSNKAKAPLPQAKRAAPTINLDAGEWAMRPGHLPPAIERYRWAIEEFRITQLAPEKATKPPVSVADLDKLWLASISP